MTRTLPRVEAAALCLGSKVWTLPRPARHHDVVIYMVSQDVSRADIAMAEQGFVDGDGHFMPRLAAMRIATRAGQLIRDPDGAELYSEDVW